MKVLFILFLVILLPLVMSVHNGFSQSLFNGTSVSILQINNAYDSKQWSTLDSYLIKGFEIKAVIPGSELDKNITYYNTNPSSVLVVLEKTNSSSIQTSLLER